MARIWKTTASHLAMSLGVMIACAPLASGQEAGTHEPMPLASMASPQEDAGPSSENDVPAEADDPGKERRMGEVIVTALRRSETLRETPASVSVLTAATLEAAGVDSLEDVSRLVPSLRFEGGIRPGVPSIAMRGISAVQGGDAPLSILVDGVQLPFLSLARTDLIDISSIEILRGPQGALYGRGAIAGALLINTRQPDDEVRVDGRLTAQTGQDYRGVATISGPIIKDVLAGKVSGSYQTRNGLLPYANIQGHADFADIGSLNGQLVYTPTDTTRVQLAGMYTKGTVGTNYLAIIPGTVPGAFEDFDTYQLGNNFKNYDRRRLSTISLKVDQDMPVGKLTIVTQSAKARDYVVSDLDYGATPTRYNFNVQLDEAQNIDVRLASHDDGPFNWIIGGFYQYRIGKNYINALPDPDAPLPLPTLLSYDRNTSQSWAGYAQGTIDLTDSISMIGALRYDVDNRSDKLVNISGTGISESFSGWQPSATLKWQATDGLMLYTTYGEGFRSGGFNTSNLVAIGAERTYGSETSRGYEVGLKTSFANDAIDLSANIFHTDYDDAQYQRTVLTPVQGRFITSIASAQVEGVEADLAFHVNDELTLNGSVSVSDTRIEDYDGTTLFVGAPLPGAFSDNEQLSVQYRPALGGDFHGLFRLDVTRRGEIAYDLGAQVKAEPATFVGARVGVENDRWSLTVFGENLTDERVPEFAFPNLFGVNHGRLANQPIRGGIEFNVHFGR